MIVSVKSFPKSVAYTFADGTVVRVSKRNYQPDNKHDEQRMAERAYLIRASESYEVQELLHAISCISDKMSLLKNYARKIEAGKGPMAEAMQAHHYTNPNKVARGLRAATKGVKAAIRAVCDSGFFDAATRWNELNEQAEPEVDVEAAGGPPVNRLKSIAGPKNGHPKAESNGAR